MDAIFTLRIQSMSTKDGNEGWACKLAARHLQDKAGEYQRRWHLEGADLDDVLGPVN